MASSTSIDQNRGGGGRRGYSLPPPAAPLPAPPGPYGGNEKKLQQQLHQRDDVDDHYYRGGDNNDYNQQQQQQRRDCGGDSFARPAAAGGGTSGGRDHRSRPRRYDSDWKCSECKTWNFPQERSCARCGGDPPPSAAGGGSRDGHYGGGGGGGGGDSLRQQGGGGGNSQYYSRDDPDETSYYSSGRTRYREEDDRYYEGDQDDYNSSDEGPPEGDDACDELEEDQEIDEFGRLRKKAKKDERREWPPHFERNGTAFVFDGRCAMFYEAESDFFYDPKTKLYYGNRQNSYYRYEEERDPPFVKVTAEASSAAGAVSNPAATAAQHTMDLEPVFDTAARPVTADSSASLGGKKSIAIKLKTKSLKSKKKASAGKTAGPSGPLPGASVAPAAGSGRIQKTHLVDMEKWSGRQQEKKQEAAVASKTGCGKESDSGGNTKGSCKEEVAKTAKGEPICRLCRRKFPSLEKLKYHEQVSKLHKDNLAKQKKKEEEEGATAEAKKANDARAPAFAGAVASGKATYVDRAQQRRNMHGPESSTILPPAMVAAPSLAPGAAALEDVPATEAEKKKKREQQHDHEPLGKDTVGHKMLSKLGWNAGSTLGAASRGAEHHRQQHEAITRDWDRIESIAAAAAATAGQRQHRPSTSYGASGGGGSSNRNGGIGSCR